MRDMGNLDFVRSVAVISVVVEHTLMAQGIHRVGPFDIDYLGVLGVLVFFVLTALVLMWSLERKPHTLDFYVRRFFRIYPLAWAAILIAWIFRAPTAGTAYQFFAYAHPTWIQLIFQSILIRDVNGKLLNVMWSLPLLRGQSLPVRLLGELVPLVALPVIAYHLLEHPMIQLGSRIAAKAEARYEQREMESAPALSA